MRHRFDEIYFDSRSQALSHLPWLRDEEFTLYCCNRCGQNFASMDPSTDTGAIICGTCEREVLR